MKHKLVPVLALPGFDPAQDRIDLHLPEGQTIADIVALVLPGATARDLDHLRVALVTPEGSIIVAAGRWHRIRPRAGVRVVIRVVPGKDSLKTLLQIVVAVAAVALGQYWATFAFQVGTTGYNVLSAAIAMGVNVLGNLLINALIPPPKPDSLEAKARYSIAGWRNRFDPDGAVPVVMGTIRVAPPFAATSFTQIIGDDQHLVALFSPGYGRLSLTDFRIGETSIADYDEVEIEVRDGLADDLPVSLYTSQVVEENVGAEITRPLPRDDLGEVIDGDAIETPVVRSTGADAAGASVIIAFPAGMVRYSDAGSSSAYTVSVRIEQRLAEADPWLLVTTLDITARKLEAFYRQHTWQFPSRGRWQVRMTMLTPEANSTQIQSRTTWAALQTLRPEYPLAFSHPLALIAIRIKATHQLNGQLDSFNCLASRICPDWDHETETWVERATSNPASLLLYVLRSPANPRPVADSGIDLAAFVDWHDFCRIKGLKYDRVLEQPNTTLSDIRAEIAAAGRASPRHDGTRWSVVIDRPQALVIDHINPRNSWDFSCSRTYFDPPDGIRVKFEDASNDFRPGEWIIPWPGHSGPITITEEMQLPGKTNPPEIWIEIRRRMYEAIYRPDSFTVMMEGPARVATRGDQVMLSTYVLTSVQMAARVISVTGLMVVLDEEVTGTGLGLRFRAGITAEDTIGTSVVRPIVTISGNAVVLGGDGDMPVAGDLVHIGPVASDSYALIVKDVEAGEDFAERLRLIDASPIIDTLTDAEVPPAWSGRVGAVIDENLLQPSAPRFVSIRSGISGTGSADRIDYTIEPGSGAILAAGYEIDHRAGTSGAWTTIAIPAANGGGAITAHTSGTAVQMQARAVSPTGVEGPATSIVSFTVGAGDAGIPDALDAGMITIGALLGGAVVQFSTGPDAATTQVQIYRSTSSTLDRETDAAGAPRAVEPSRSYSVPVGDSTRTNLLINSGFDSAGTWTLGTGWSIAAGVASHAAGTSAGLSQALTTVAGRWYRVAYTLSSVSAGSITPRLTGGSNRDGTAASANGPVSDRIQAVTGNVTVEWLATSSFAGSIDNAIAYEETSTCLSQGIHYFWVEPQNADGVPGPVAGPFSVTIR